MAKKSTKKNLTKRQRHERRFLPQSSSNPWIVRVPGALGAAGIGAGVWGHLYGHFVPAEGEGNAYNLPLFVLAGGAVLLAVGIWFGTSGEAAIRVGDPGIAYEKGEPRRMPWWRVKAISWESGNDTLVISGKDEADTDFVLRIPARSQPQAVAWVVKEALERIPKKVSLSESVLARIGEAPEHGGTKILLEPLTVVGRRCAASKKMIAYEPDARVCPACERVFHKDKVPRKCLCGTDLSKLGGTGPEDSDEDSDENENETSDTEVGEKEPEPA